MHDPANNNCPINADPRNESCACNSQVGSKLEGEQPKLTDAMVTNIIRQAYGTSQKAIDDHLKAIGGDQLMCGFAWVNIKPARGQFVRVMKKMKIGRTDSFYGGYTIWISHWCQNMDAKEAGARALAEELRKYGVVANVHTRLD